MHALNAWFDRIPRIWFDVGGRRVPAFRSLGIIGFHLALLVAIFTALRTGVPLATALGMSTVAGLSFFGWGLLRRAVTGQESLVLLEYVWVAYGAVALFAWASGTPLVGLFDVFSASVPWFLAFGRLGCMTVGCCYGTPAPIGLRYGAAHLLPERLVGRRLFPIQAIEAIALAGIGLTGTAFVSGPPGAATVWFLASYAVIRFGSERLRGDQRAHVWRVSVPRIMAVVQLAAAVVASEAWLVDGPPGRSAVLGAILLGTALTASAGKILRENRNPLLNTDHLDEVWNTIRSTRESAATSSPIITTTTKEMVVAVSALQSGWHVSFSHPTHSTVEAALTLGGTLVSTSNHIVQFVIAPSWSSAGETAHETDSDEQDEESTSTSSNFETSGSAATYFTAPSVTRGFLSRNDVIVGNIDQHGGGALPGPG